MVTTTDEFGQWLLVSSPVEVLTNYKKWVALGNYHIVSSGTYRFTFLSPDFLRVNSYAWIRSVHRMPNSTNEIVSPARRLYPKPEKFRMEFPIPANLISIGVQEQRLEFKPLFKRYRNTSKLWSVQCEQLVFVQKQSDNTTTLRLSTVTYSRDPIKPDLWISSFTEEVRDKRGIILENFEIGRFYLVSDNSPVSDPVVLESSNGILTVAFTSPEVIQPDTVYVRVIY